jgi:hypothetical protein
MNPARISADCTSPPPPPPKRSPTIAAMPTIRHLILLGNLARAAARNRIAQRKVLVYPSELRFPEGVDFGEDLQRTLTAGISDEYSAAAVAPPVIESPAEYKDGWFTLDLTTDWDERLPELTDHAIRRLALQMDMPPEVMLGMGDANHWSAWQVEEATYRAHVAPLAVPVANTLRDALMAASDELASRDVQVVPDPAELLRRNPTTVDAFRAFELGIVSDEYVRAALGADADDAGTGIPLRVSGQRATTTDDTRTGVTAAAAPTEGEALGAALARIDEDVLTAGRVALSTGVDRAREKVGAKLRTLVRGTPELAARIDGVDNRDVAAVLGDDAPAFDMTETVDTALTGLGDWWVREVGAALGRVKSVSGAVVRLDPEDVGASEVLLTGTTAAHVAATLTRATRDLPAPPLDNVRRAMAVAGGNGDPDAGVIAAADPGAGRGLATGRAALQALSDQLGWRVSQWRWMHGDPANPHPVHQALNGKVTTAEGTIQTAEGWTAFPNDHKGCLCTLAPFLRKDAPQA